MPDLPPIGSLWLHRWNRERRRVLHVEDSMLHDVHYTDQHMARSTSCRLTDWLAWQAGAVRIDREEA